MKVVVLSVCDAVDAHLIERLRSALPDVELVRVISRPKRPATPPSVWSKVSLTKLRNRAEDVFRNWHYGRTRKETSHHLFGVPKAPTPTARAEVFSSEVNDPKTADRIRELAPDLLLVSGAPILKPIIFSIPKVATVNVHYGVAPHYRGENTIFWPLYLGDHERIGVTLHHINPGIDSGQILAVGYPALEPDDTEGTLMGKCARLAADLAIDLVGAAERGALVGQTQVTKGKLFLKKDRRFLQDARYELERRIKRRTLPVTSSRVEKHFL